MASSAGIFGQIADLLVAIYKAHGFEWILKWVDDFFVVRKAGETWSEDDFIRLTSILGVPWALDKTKLFAFIQRFIGFDWDLANCRVSFPVDKLAAVILLIESWINTNGPKFSRHDAASLHGKLVHCSSIYPLIRPFLPSISRFSTSFISDRAHLRPPKSVLTDLQWIRTLLDHLPNSLPLSSMEPFDLDWWGDASTSFGVGVTVGSFWGVWRWADNFKVGPKCKFDIGWAEAVAVELGLLMADHHGLVSGRPAHQACFLVRSDNVGVVEVIKGGRSRNGNTNDVLKRLYIQLARHSIHLSPVYVASRDNVTDALSRGDIPAFTAGFPSAKQRSDISLPSHLRDFLVPHLLS